MALLRFEAGLVSAVLLLLILFIRDKPRHPPSRAAAVQNTQDYSTSLKNLLKSKDYLLLLLSVSMGYGCLISFFATVEFYVHPFNFSNNAQIVSLLLSAATVFGLLGSVFMSWMVKRSMQFKKILVICYLAGAVEMVMIYFSFEAHSLHLVAVTGAFVGFFILPATPLTLQLGCEIAFPVKEATVAGLLLAGAQVTGFVFGFPMLELYDKVLASSWYATLIYAAMFLLAALGILLAKLDLKRSEFDLQLRRQDEEA